MGEDKQIEVGGTDIMLDIETLGTRPGSAIWQIGGCVLDDPACTFLRDVIVGSELEIDPETVRWLLDQDADVRRAFSLGQLGGMPLHEVLFNLKDWLEAQEQPVRVWGKGPSFDCALVREAAARVVPGLYLWDYRNERCVRTVLALLDPNRVYRPDRQAQTRKHDALGDALHQAEWVRRVLCAHGLMTPTPEEGT